MAEETNLLRVADSDAELGGSDGYPAKRAKTSYSDRFAVNGWLLML